MRECVAFGPSERGVMGKPTRGEDLWGTCGEMFPGPATPSHPDLDLPGSPNSSRGGAEKSPARVRKRKGKGALELARGVANVKNPTALGGRASGEVRRYFNKSLGSIPAAFNPSSKAWSFRSVSLGSGPPNNRFSTAFIDPDASAATFAINASTTSAAP